MKITKYFRKQFSSYITTFLISVQMYSPVYILGLQLIYKQPLVFLQLLDTKCLVGVFSFAFLFRGSFLRAPYDKEQKTIQYKQNIVIARNLI